MVLGFDWAQLGGFVCLPHSHNGTQAGAGSIRGLLMCTMGKPGQLGLLGHSDLSVAPPHGFFPCGAFREHGGLRCSGLQKHRPQRESQVESTLLFLNEVLKSEHSHFPESHRGQPIFKGKVIRLYLWLAGASKDLQTCFTTSTGWAGSLASLFFTKQRRQECHSGIWRSKH